MNFNFNILLVFIVVFYANNIVSQNHFTWTPELEIAYKEAISLRFDAAEKTLINVEESDPYNLLRLHVENYIDFFKVYIGEEEEVFEKLEKNKDKRLSEIERMEMLTHLIIYIFKRIFVCNGHSPDLNLKNMRLLFLRLIKPINCWRKILKNSLIFCQTKKTLVSCMRWWVLFLMVINGL